MGYYDVALVCLNGHVVNSRYRGQPQFNQRFCDECGAETIHECPNCHTAIQGEYIVPEVICIGSGHETAPRYCQNCGKPFPWTEARLQAARELAQEADGLEANREELVGLLPDLASDTARTEVAAAKWKIALTKVGGVVGSALEKIIVEIASETAKKALL